MQACQARLIFETKKNKNCVSEWHGFRLSRVASFAPGIVSMLLCWRTGPAVVRAHAWNNKENDLVHAACWAHDATLPAARVQALPETPWQGQAPRCKSREKKKEKRSLLRVRLLAGRQICLPPCPLGTSGTHASSETDRQAA